MNRAYSTLEIKSADGDSRRFTGIASTPSTDRVGDIVEPDGAEFKLPLPLLWQHNSRDPIGWVKKAKVNSKGIEIEGEIAKIDELGQLQRHLSDVWQMIKSGLVRGLSIGFKDLESAEIKGTWGTRFIKWEWLELSAVTIPANTEATITAIKSIDKEFLAASGRKINSSGVSGKTKEKSMKTLQEQLAELKEARKTKAARMNELAEIVKTEARAWAETESTEFESLEKEINQLDGDIRMKTVECMNAGTAKEIPNDPPRGPMFWKKPDDEKEKFPGQNFTRKAIAKALAYLDLTPIGVVAERRWGKTSPKLVEIIKTDMQAGSSTGSHWASDLVITDGRYTGDFIEYLKAKTVFDRLPLKEVPANVTIKGQDGAATGYWIAEGTAIKVSEFTTTSVALTPLKVAGLTVLTNELLRDSSPAAEALVRDALVTALAQIVDTTFLGAAASGTGYPAGILNALVAITTNGTDGAAVRADVRDLLAPFLTAKIPTSGLYFVMQPSLATSIQLLSNTLGLQEFPNINADGGNLLGYPVVTGDNVGSQDLILLKPSEIWRIGDAGVEVSVSREASIEMADNPAQEANTPTGPTGKVVNMFQTECTAFKVVRSVNFKKRRTQAVQFIDAASYGTAGS